MNIDAQFDLIKQDLEKTPPQLTQIPHVIQLFANGLKRFVPSKQKIHEQIEKDLLIQPFIEITIEKFPHIVSRLIYWIEQFQAPAYDNITQKWATQLIESKTPTDIAQFFKDFYYHSQDMYRLVWEARKRLVTGENIIPPEHRPKHTGSNGIPHNMKAGR
jgi:hypothetical protein